MARKEYTYNLIDKNGQTVCQDKTRVNLILLLGADLNLGNCARTGALVKGRYQLERCREFERENTLDDKNCSKNGKTITTWWIRWLKL